MLLVFQAFTLCGFRYIETCAISRADLFLFSAGNMEQIAWVKQLQICQGQ